MFERNIWAVPAIMMSFMVQMPGVVSQEGDIPLATPEAIKISVALATHQVKDGAPATYAERPFTVGDQMKFELVMTNISAQPMRTVFRITFEIGRSYSWRSN